jgi:hypothetical protein
MIRQSDTSSSQTRFIRSADQKGADYFIPDNLHQYNHLIPPMKKVLKFTANATWFMMKTLVRAAFHLPALMRKTASQTKPQPAPKRSKLPSPQTAFPAP